MGDGLGKLGDGLARDLERKKENLVLPTVRSVRLRGRIGLTMGLDAVCVVTLPWIVE